MDLYSSSFFCFVVISMVIYYLLPGMLQNIFLLLVSYIFYSSWDWRFSVVLILLTLFNYYWGSLLFDSSQEKGKLMLRLGILFNIAFLVIYLTGRSIGGELSKLFSAYTGNGVVLNILLPLGFAYRALENISYLVDIHMGIGKPAKSLLNYSLYMAYFPKLISGPIERARIFLPRLDQKFVVDDVIISRSLMLVFLGLFRSIVIAGMLRVLALSDIFTDPLKYSSTEIVMGIIIYAFFLYNQFAGYTELMRGISGFFGIELSRNFAYPHFSKSFSDLWKRWHISLSQWLRDYIYMPLSRYYLRKNPSRRNLYNLIIPPLVTFLASGFWHGSRLNLFLWGAINGAYIIGENIVNLFLRARPSESISLWRKTLTMWVVFCLAILAAIPFRLDLPASKVYFYGIVKLNRWLLPDFRPLLVLTCSLLVDWFQYRVDDEFVFLQWSYRLKMIGFSMGIFAMIVVYNFQAAMTTFVYP
jgi:alginate O-acetyltransferase complex protein AlgI